MSTIKTVPTVLVHKIDSGGTLSGAAPNGNDSGESNFRGRYRVYDECTVGGLVELDQTLRCGFRVEKVSWNMTGLTGVDLYLVDPDGFEYWFGGGTGANNAYEWRDGGLLVPPDFTFKAVSQGGTLSADGAVMFVIGQGWKQTTFENNTRLGVSKLPPNQY